VVLAPQVERTRSDLVKPCFGSRKVQIESLQTEGIPDALNRSRAAARRSSQRPQPDSHVTPAPPDSTNSAPTPPESDQQDNRQVCDQPPANPSRGSVGMTGESKSVAGATRHTNQLRPNLPRFQPGSTELCGNQRKQPRIDESDTNCNHPVAKVEITSVRSVAIGFRDRRKYQATNPGVQFSSSISK
jgi:hypothetical protein